VYGKSRVKIHISIAKKMLLENFRFDAQLNASVSEGFLEHFYLKIENKYDY
jgi:hypothetical protein